jgi:hypothetical protein
MQIYRNILRSTTITSPTNGGLLHILVVIGLAYTGETTKLKLVYLNLKCDVSTQRRRI